MNNNEKNNIERLTRYIERVEGLVSNTEARMTAGAGWLDAQLGSLKHLLNDFREQLAETTKSNDNDEVFVLDDYGQHTGVVPEWMLISE